MRNWQAWVFWLLGLLVARVAIAVLVSICSRPNAEANILATVIVAGSAPAAGRLWGGSYGPGKNGMNDIAPF